MTGWLIYGATDVAAYALSGRGGAAGAFLGEVSASFWILFLVPRLICHYDERTPATVTDGDGPVDVVRHA